MASIGASACSAIVSVTRLKNTGSVIVAHRLSCPLACGIFLDQGLNLCLLHCQADSLPLSHQRSPGFCTFNTNCSVLATQGEMQLIF